MYSAEFRRLQSARSAAPTMWVKPKAQAFWTNWPNSVIGAIIAVFFGLVLEAPAVFGADVADLYSRAGRWEILIAYIVCLSFPIAHTVRILRRSRDFFQPELTATLTYLTFHLLMSSVIVGSRVNLQIWHIVSQSDGDLTPTILLAYLVLLVAWLGILCGIHLYTFLRAKMARRRHSPDVVQKKFRRSSNFYLLFGGIYILIAIVGNMMASGGLSNYLAHIPKFFVRSDTYVETMAAGGSEKWDIFMRFGPVGLLVLACGFAFQTGSFQLPRRRKLIIALVVATVVNVFLSSATGERSYTMMVAFYSVIVWNAFIRRLKLRNLAAIAAIVSCAALFLGVLRAAAHFGTDAKSAITNNLGEVATRFGGLYLTDFLGTTTLVQEVQESGTVHGETAFAGLTGLLGGATPMTTQNEVWFRRTGKYNTNNPRYGPPGELYFNYGMVGVFIGMSLMGMLIGWLQAAYMKAKGEVSIRSALILVFTTFTANFIPIGNLSYIPGYFLIYSVIFYFGFYFFKAFA